MQVLVKYRGAVCMEVIASFPGLHPDFYLAAVEEFLHGYEIKSGRIRRPGNEAMEVIHDGEVAGSRVRRHL